MALPHLFVSQQHRILAGETPRRAQRGSLHTLPFLVPNLHIALTLAYVVMAVELVLIAAIRHRFFGTSWWLSILQVVGGGALVFAAALFFGNA